MAEWLRLCINGCIGDVCYTGADPGFQVRGAHLKKMRRAEGGANIFGVFRVKNHDFTPKNHIFSNFRGARAGCAPRWIRPCYKCCTIYNNIIIFFIIGNYDIKK